MSPERFNHLLCLVEESIIKRITQFRMLISPQERLALTLRFLASGESQHELFISYWQGNNLAGN